jgi:peptide/nickel transport system substrate-binding protein
LGISNAPSQSAERGVRQVLSNLATEGLLRVNPEGRLEPLLAEKWQQSQDGLHLNITLRPNVRFHDGTAVTADVVAEILRSVLPKNLRSIFDDVDAISAKNEREIEIAFRQPSPFVADSFIDVPIQKLGAATVGTGPFAVKSAEQTKNGAAEMEAFDGYYLGRPQVDRVAIRTYANSRAAWADMLRNELDMLYEVSADTVDTMHGAKNVAVFAFDRPFQYLIFLNPRNPKLKAAETRRALNLAIDRTALVRDALGGHGAGSAGPVSPRHWAFHPVANTFRFNPGSAAAALSGRRLTLRCLTPAEQPFEQLALVVKQQFNAVGIDLQIEQVPLEQLSAAIGKPDSELVLAEASLGGSLLRSYRWWHSHGAANASGFSSPDIDAALDRVRHAIGDDEYRDAVGAFQAAVENDPPAVFLAWSERSRAISTRFEVKQDRGRDVLASLRLLKPVTDTRNATPN